MIAAPFRPHRRGCLSSSRAYHAHHHMFLTQHTDHVEFQTKHIDLIRRILTLPCKAQRYHLSEELTALYPGKTIIEICSYTFDLSGYAQAGHCRIAPNPVIHTHTEFDWDHQDRKLTSSYRNAWLDITWRDQHLEVLRLDDGPSDSSLFWIMADQADLAARFVSAVYAWSTEVRDEVMVFEQGYWSKSEELFQAISRTTREQLVLPEELKHQLFNDVEGFFAARETYRRYKVPWKRGLLLAGPPGNGKTHAVKALVNAVGKPCLYVRSLIAHHQNEHYSIRDIFSTARQLAPCVLVLEDLDTLVTPDNRSFFLNELDGFASNEGLLTLATTNYPERLDQAIRDRPSRFDRTYTFSLPAEPERHTYLERWNADLATDLHLSPEGLAQAAAQTEGFSFAYLKELMLAATMAWVGASRPGSMDTVLGEQIAQLRQQQQSASSLVS